ncbi:MAG: helix-turn-helix domain-containing protein [Candidatus Limnocylindria bacterium]
MGSRTSVLREATRLGDWILRDIGRELRVARMVAGSTQKRVGALIGKSASHVSRVEHGLIKGIGIAELTVHAAAVGLKPWVKLFPAISRPMDQAQLNLLAKFRERIGSAWQVVIEAPMPIAGDLRAADALLIIPGSRCVVEIITRLADLQAQRRAGQLKVRDLKADRLILVVAGTTTNRRALHSAGPTVTDAFPVDTRAALAALAAGEDPGGDALILL